MMKMMSRIQADTARLTVAAWLADWGPDRLQGILSKKTIRDHVKKLSKSVAGYYKTKKKEKKVAWTTKPMV